MTTIAKKIPPEQDFNSPEEYYSEAVTDAYTHSKALMRIQEKITKRALEILDAESPALVLDIGMGCGFSTSYLYLLGYDVTGIDIIYDMLSTFEIPELNPVNADMKNIPFRDAQFDYIISISAFQWLLNKIGATERRALLIEAAKQMNRLLKSGGKAIIQFYPLNQEGIKEIGEIFADFGHFEGNFIIDNPEGTTKRKLFLSLKKN